MLVWESDVGALVFGDACVRVFELWLHVGMCMCASNNLQKRHPSRDIGIMHTWE